MKPWLGMFRRTALGTFRVLSDFTIGFALAEARGFALEPGRSRLDATALPADAFPQVARLAPHLGAGDRDADFEFGLELILTGLRAALHRRTERDRAYGP